MKRTKLLSSVFGLDPVDQKLNFQVAGKSKALVLMQCSLHVNLVSLNFGLSEAILILYSCLNFIYAKIS